MLTDIVVRMEAFLAAFLFSFLEGPAPIRHSRNYNQYKSHLPRAKMLSTSVKKPKIHTQQGNLLLFYDMRMRMAVCKCLYIVQQQTQTRKNWGDRGYLQMAPAPLLLLFPLSTYHVYFFPFAQDTEIQKPQKANRQANMQQILIQNTHANFSNSLGKKGKNLGKSVGSGGEKWTWRCETDARMRIENVQQRMA